MTQVEGLIVPRVGTAVPRTLGETAVNGHQIAPGAEAEPLDPASRYALDHSGLGPADLVVDCAGLVVAVLLVASARALLHGQQDYAADVAFLATFKRLALCVPVLAAALASTRRRSLLHPAFFDQVHTLALPIAAGGLVSLAIWSALTAVSGIDAPKVDWVLATCLLSVTTVALARVARHRIRKGDSSRTHRVLIVGSGVVADRVAQQMDATPGVEVVGYVDDDPVDPARCLGKLGHLAGICEQESVGHVVVAFSRSNAQEIIDALRPMQGRLPITVVPRLFEVLPPSAKVHELGSGLSGLNVAPASLGPWSRTLKIGTDLLVAGIGLLLLLPLFVTVALMVRLTSRGPALFRQVRVGRNGRHFSVLKFRTMYTQKSHMSAAEIDGETAVGPFPKLKNDPRVTPIGRLLRKTSIDELPQLWNVLRGEMSLVGPRPFMLEDAAAIDGWALRRYSVRPGLTGLWQVSGRNELTFAEMCRLDQLYVNCWSIGLDLRILLRTLWVVLGRDGAY